MKTSSSLFLITLALVACHREQPLMDIPIRVECRSCSVRIEQTRESPITDTIIGTLVYSWNNGEATVDTIAATATYQTSLGPGESLWISACTLDTAQAHPSITVQGTTITGACAEYHSP